MWCKNFTSCLEEEFNLGFHYPGSNEWCELVRNACHVTKFSRVTTVNYKKKLKRDYPGRQLFSVIKRTEGSKNIFCLLTPTQPCYQNSSDSCGDRGLGPPGHMDTNGASLCADFQTLSNLRQQWEGDLQQQANRSTALSRKRNSSVTLGLSISLKAAISL